MWSFVGGKARARWLWHAVDHHIGRVLAYVVGTQKDAMFMKLQALLAPFGITRYYTDKAGVYQRYLPPEQHVSGHCRGATAIRGHVSSWQASKEREEGKSHQRLHVIFRYVR